MSMCKLVVLCLSNLARLIDCGFSQLYFNQLMVSKFTIVAVCLNNLGGRNEALVVHGESFT